jgi:hypothetical protein
MEVKQANESERFALDTLNAFCKDPAQEFRAMSRSALARAAHVMQPPIDKFFRGYRGRIFRRVARELGLLEVGK